MKWFRWNWNKCIRKKNDNEIEILKNEGKKIRNIIDRLNFKAWVWFKRSWFKKKEWYNKLLG